MKFKYKKIILVTLVSTMGIGAVTLAVTPKDHKVKETAKVASVDQNVASLSEITNAVTPIVTPTITVTIAPTLAPTPTPLPVYDLENEGYPKIETLMKNYYEAKLDCNAKSLKKLLSDPTDIPSKKQLKKDVQFVEGYNKIKCYVKKGFQEGSYIVFVYNEIKFVNIKTSAPAVDRFYVITDANGDVKIFSGKLDSDTDAYYKARTNDTDVQELIAKTEKTSDKAKAKDKALKTFWNKLAKMQEND